MIFILELCWVMCKVLKIGMEKEPENELIIGFWVGSRFESVTS